MTAADDILNQIDRALGDTGVGPDAMRCAPADDDPTEPQGIRGFTPTLRIIDEAGEWRQVEGVAAIEVHIDPSAAIEQLRRLQEAFEVVRPRIEERFREIARAFESLKQAGVCDDHGKPLPPPDRPAWQSRYGPPQRRRRR